jgi:type IV secretory pathway VirD2 relaxase
VVEKDLKTKLEWVAAVHYDTDDRHAHVIIRGKNERGKTLLLAEIILPQAYGAGRRK